MLPDHDTSQLRFLADNPLLRRSLRLTRPAAAINRLGAQLVLGVLLAMGLAVPLSGLAAKLYLDELTTLLAPPVFLLYGFFSWFAIRSFLRSGVPEELRLTLLRPAEVVAGLHAGLVLRGVLALTSTVALLPLYTQTFVPINGLAHLLYVLGFALLFESAARLILLICLETRGLATLILVLGTSFSAILVLYGLSGVLRGQRESVLGSGALGGFLVGLIAMFSVGTWRPFVEAAGKNYDARVKVLCEGDEAAARDVERGRFYGPEEE